MSDTLKGLLIIALCSGLRMDSLENLKNKASKWRTLFSDFCKLILLFAGNSFPKFPELCRISGIMSPSNLVCFLVTIFPQENINLF